MRLAASEMSHLSPAVFAFWKRNLRGAEKKTKINLRGIPVLKQRLRTKPPKLPSKNKGGAPKGNRNGRKHGLYTKEMRDLRLATRGMVARLKLEAALVRAKAARMDAETYIRLRDAGLRARALWPSEN